MGAPDELGRRLTDHRPINPLLAGAACAVPGLLIGAGLAFGAVGSTALGLFCFVLMTVLLLYLFAESLFVRQQVFEHGLLLGSTLPMTPRYVIPYATIDPDSVSAAPYHRPKGAADVTDTFNRCYRQAPTVAVVTFVGIAPKIARRVAKGRPDAPSAVASALSLPTEFRNRSGDFEQWFVSFRDNAAAAELIREYVRRATGQPQ